MVGESCCAKESAAARTASAVAVERADRVRSRGAAVVVLEQPAEAGITKDFALLGRRLLRRNK